MRTFICSIVFLDLVGFSKKTVDEQIVLKERLNSFVTEIIANFPDSEHIAIDSGDGAAIGFVGDPEYAFFFAINLRDTIMKKGSGMTARIGINLGPVKLVKDINGQPNLIGDGINVAQRIMSFAEPNQVTVSRSFHEVTSCLSKDIADLYHYLGSRTDKNIRKYQVYTIGEPQLNSNMIKDTSVSGTLDGAAIAQSGYSEETNSSNAAKRNYLSILSSRWRENKWLYGVSAAAVIAAVSFVLLQAIGKTDIAKQKNTGQNIARAFVPLTSAGKMKQEKDSSADIQFKVSPQGVIYIDGEKKGIAPTLRYVKVGKGEHTIVIKHEHFKDYRRVVNLAPQESLLIEHSFRKHTTTAAKKNMGISKPAYKTAGKREKSNRNVSPAAFTSNVTPR